MEMGKGTCRQIAIQVSDESLKADLEKYRQMALDMGATEAEIIPAGWVEVDERVLLKCQVPFCMHYGRCANCPPHAPPPDLVRQSFARFKWAVLFKADAANVADLADMARYWPNGQKEQRRSLDIVNEIESQAFADGHYLAVGFSAGSCQDGLCGGHFCQMLDSGRCPFYLRARPSMEAVGIDVCDLINKIGWQIYPIYRRVDPALVPCAISVGVVFIR
ncbi:MAG: DUF2284 domain-containing protein [Chloroflexi bacterium]|nr:DUF2284 domain-containing protein [Chloroflexota bacterium]